MAELEQKFKVGDVVTLKSESPKMTISKLNMKVQIGGVNSGKMMFTGNVECQWFLNDELKNATFNQDSLELFGK